MRVKWILLGALLYSAAIEVASGLTFEGWREVPGGGTTLVADAATVYRGKLYLFGIGTGDHQHYVNVLDGVVWSGWTAIPGGGTTLLPDSTAVFQDKLYLFGIGTGDHQHYVDVLDGVVWSGWTAIPGGGTTEQADAAATFGNKLYVFAIGIGDHSHYMNAFNGASWSGWSPVPGGEKTLLADAATVYQDKLYLFSVDANDNAHHVNAFDGTNWDGWTAIPGGGQTALSDAAATSGDKLYLFGVGIGDHAHYVNVLQGATWSGWTPVQGNGTTSVADAAVAFAGSIYLFSVGTGDEKHYVNATAGFPRYNEVAFKATHNSYWVKRDNVAEAAASGTEERILDQLLFEGVRSIELDVHRDDPHAHQFTVYHTDKSSNSLCSTLDECMKQLVAFQHALPQHDVLTIVLELKEIVWGGPFDDNHTPQDLDAIIERYLGQHLFRPRDLLARCSPGATIRGCLRQQGWPSLYDLRGKIMITIIGNWNGVSGAATETCGPHSIDNRGSWVAYANKPGGIAARSAFLMESPWASAAIACQSSFNQAQVDAALLASGFVQLEIGNRSGLACSVADPKCPRSWVSANLVVRGDVGGDNKPTMDDQAALVQAGISLIQNDHPWYAWSDSSPLRPGIPIHPEQLPGSDSINEPGHRILVMQQRSGARATFPASFGGTIAPSTRWETLVSNTRPTTDSGFGNPRRPRGTGCIYARTPTDAAGNVQYGIRICRTTADGHFDVSKPLGEDVIVTVDVTQNRVTTTSTVYSNANDTNGAGELLRLDVGQVTGGNTCVNAFTSELVIGDEPEWMNLRSACFPTTLADQGLSAEGGDVLFVGTKLASSNTLRPPASAINYFDLADSKGRDYNVLNLTWPH